MEKIFNASQFVPTKYSTAEEKAKFANQFVKFVDNGCQLKHFPKWFYRRLSMTFGHIAHYNLEGFYDTWFCHPSSLWNFIQHTLGYPCYGDPEYTYSDVEKAIQEWLGPLATPLMYM